MKNIYTVRFETTRAFSTARKAIEHAQLAFSDWEVPIFTKDGMGVKSNEPLNSFKTESLISQLGRDEYISAYDGRDCVYINKIVVE